MDLILGELWALRKYRRCAVRKSNRSRGWNGVPPESMKKQPRILRRCAPQDDSAEVVARSYFQGGSFRFATLRVRMTAFWDSEGR